MYDFDIAVIKWDTVLRLPLWVSRMELAVYCPRLAISRSRYCVHAMYSSFNSTFVPELLYQWRVLPTRLEAEWKQAMTTPKA
jgi:hypothetical protein